MEQVVPGPDFAAEVEPVRGRAGTSKAVGLVDIHLTRFPAALPSMTAKPETIRAQVRKSGHDLI